MRDALYREIRHKMNSGADRFSVVIPYGDDNALMDVNHMVLDDGMVWAYDNSQPKDAPNGRCLSFIKQRALRESGADEDDDWDE